MGAMGWGFWFQVLSIGIAAASFVIAGLALHHSRETRKSLAPAPSVKGLGPNLFRITFAGDDAKHWEICAFRHDGEGQIILSAEVFAADPAGGVTQRQPICPGAAQIEVQPGPGPFDVSYVEGGDAIAARAASISALVRKRSLPSLRIWINTQI
jgi:hypothetical protein